MKEWEGTVIKTECTGFLWVDINEWINFGLQIERGPCALKTSESFFMVLISIL